MIAGRDACGTAYGTSTPLRDAETLLSRRQSSWNRAVITAGIDDTNWGDRIAAIVAREARSVMLESGCAKEVGKWDGYRSQVQNTILRNADAILGGLMSPVTGDPLLRVAWLSYYNIAGTGPVSAVCDQPFQDAMTTLHNFIRLGLQRSGLPYRWIDTDAVLHEASALIQPFYQPGDLCVWDLGCKSNPPGWPHPNASGAATVGGLPGY